MMGKLKGKVAIVTGGARGIGAACAEVLCREGAAVMITDLLEAEANETLEKLRAGGGRAGFVRHDVRNAGDWQAVVEKTCAEFGRVDCLVNNAGISSANTIDEVDIEDFRRLLDVNLMGPILGMQAVAPVMKQQGGGSIINISSNSTYKVMALTTTYGASKAAVAYVTKSAAIHYATSGYGIRVNSVHPGPIETPMLLGGKDHAADAEIPAVRRLIDSIPMGRMGRPGEIGAVVAFLASDDASFMTASELFADGGLTVV